MPDENAERSVARRDLLASLTAALVPGVLLAQDRPRTRDAPRIGTARFELERFIDDCRAANSDSDRPAAVEEVLIRAIERPPEVLAALGEPDKAGIKTLYRSGDLTILNIVWAPLMQLMPHEHRMWAVSGIYTGREDNILWERSPARIEARGSVSFGEREIISLPRDVIHSVVNPIQKFTGALHIYGGDFFATPRSEWDPGTHDERSWDMAKAVQLFEESNNRFRAWSTRACV